MEEIETEKSGRSQTFDYYANLVIGIALLVGVIIVTAMLISVRIKTNHIKTNHIKASEQSVNVAIKTSAPYVGVDTELLYNNNTQDDEVYSVLVVKSEGCYRIFSTRVALSVVPATCPLK